MNALPYIPLVVRGWGLVCVQDFFFIMSFQKTELRTVLPNLNRIQGMKAEKLLEMCSNIECKLKLV